MLAKYEAKREVAAATASVVARQQVITLGPAVLELQKAADATAAPQRTLVQQVIDYVAHLWAVIMALIARVTGRGAGTPSGASA